MSAVSSPSLSFVRLALYLVLTVAAMPFQAIAVALGLDAQKHIPRAYHRLVLWLFGFHVTMRGTPSRIEPTLFISNHTSYFDIEVLGAVITGSFIAKTEVATWPLFSLLAKLQRSVFIDRRVASMRDQRDAVQQRLDNGDNLILFPEGTSGDGTRVLPFRSALFAVADRRINGKPLTIQPVTVSYVALNGIPLGRNFRSFYAWYGDMSLPGHMWTMMGLGRTELVVVFHPPVTIESFGSRKLLARHCETVIGETLVMANAGRLPPAQPAVQPNDTLPDATAVAI